MTTAPFRNRRCVACGSQFTTREPNRVTCQNCPAPRKGKAKKAEEKSPE